MRETCHFWDACVEADGQFLFSEALYNGLFRLNLKSGKVQYVARFGEDEDVFIAHRVVVSAGEQTFFFPYRGSHIAVYRNGRIEKSIAVAEAPHFFYAAVVEDSFLLFAKDDDNIYLFDTKRMELQPDRQITKSIRRWAKGEALIRSENAYAEDERGIYILFSLPSMVLRIDKGNRKVTQFCACDRKMQTIGVYGDGLWLAPERGNLVTRVSLSAKERKTYEIAGVWQETENPFFRFVTGGDRFFLLPLKGSKVWVYQESRDEFAVLCDAEDLGVCGRKGNYKLFSNVGCMGKRLFLYPWCADSMVCVDLEIEEAKIFDLEASPAKKEMEYKALKRTLKRAIAERKPIRENVFQVTFEKFVKDLSG